MNYDDDPDFNMARTPQESTRAFAAQRQRVSDKANADFSGGVGLGLRICVVAAAVGLALLAFT